VSGEGRVREAQSPMFEKCEKKQLQEILVDCREAMIKFY
jgi:hypothetical protein